MHTLKLSFLLLLALTLPGVAIGGGPDNDYNESGPGPIQDHTCQGGHNCTGTDTGGGSQAQEQAQNQSQAQIQGQSQSADATAVAGAIAVSGSSADNTNLVSNRNDVDVNTSDYNANLNTNDNTNVAYGGSGGEGGTAYQGQNQSSDNSNSSNNSSSQSTSLTFEGTGEAKYANKYGNNVGAYAPAIYSSSACTGGGLSAGASAFGAALSLGGSKQDPQCQVRENARILSGLDTNLAIMYLCANPLVDVGAVLGSACKPSEPLPPMERDPEPPVVTPPVVFTNDKINGK